MNIELRITMVLIRGGRLYGGIIGWRGWRKL
jgi:hypothetical protein